MTEHLRPRFHFSPASGWMNDPCGLVLQRSASGGPYHLFYQYVPSDLGGLIKFHPGELRWGHATSRDMVTWRELGPALAPDAEEGAPLSGCAVIDSADTSGFGLPTGITTLFTRSRSEPAHPIGAQTIHFGASADDGASFLFAQNNPVATAPIAGASPDNFRDPKVSWFDAGSGAGFWVMAVAAGRKIAFFRSDNLMNWVFISDIAVYPDQLAGGPLVECPDLMLLPNADGGPARWVLAYSELHWPLVGEDSKTWYVVGSFDGTRFRAEVAAGTTFDLLSEVAVRLDHGPDYYASQSWFLGSTSLLGLLGARLFGWMGAVFGGRIGYWPPSSPVIAGWVNNWRYAQRHAIEGRTDPWHGHLSVPRLVNVGNVGGQTRVLQTPHPNLRTLRRGTLIDSNGGLLNGSDFLVRVPPGADGTGQWDLGLRFSTTGMSADRVGIRIRSDDETRTEVRWDRATRQLFFDRTPPPGATNSDRDFFRMYWAPLPAAGGVIALRILIDRDSIEVFGGRGETVMTGLFFPAPSSGDIELFTIGGSVEIQRLRLFAM